MAPAQWAAGENAEIVVIVKMKRLLYELFGQLLDQRSAPTRGASTYEGRFPGCKTTANAVKFCRRRTRL